MTHATTSCIAPKCTRPRELGAVFCVVHLAAPAGQRGGWLSAHRRRRLAGGSSPAAVNDPPLDASNVARRLWVGGKPPLDRPLPFDMLVLCAQEIQPASVGFLGRLIRCPIPDSVLSSRETRRALLAGGMVAKALTAGHRVLVTCAQGRNRSALVASLGLGLVTQLTAPELMELMRERRHPDCLSNPDFQSILRRYIGDGRR